MKSFIFYNFTKFIRHWVHQLQAIISWNFVVSHFLLLRPDPKDFWGLCRNPFLSEVSKVFNWISQAGHGSSKTSWSSSHSFVILDLWHGVLSCMNEFSPYTRMFTSITFSKKFVCLWLSIVDLGGNNSNEPRPSFSIQAQTIIERRCFTYRLKYRCPFGRLRKHPYVEKFLCCSRHSRAPFANLPTVSTSYSGTKQYGPFASLLWGEVFGRPVWSQTNFSLKQLSYPSCRNIYCVLF